MIIFKNLIANIITLNVVRYECLLIMLRQSKGRKIRCNVMGQTAEPHKTFEYYVRGHCTAVALSSVEQ